ncbi:hypothetical protein M426DRAFT_136745 [Hypoxylon sp. CI-4A]|nr:hypothetical protein M426DRAFT_136745 [Hypoxylon sp. CI-4A]
MFTLLGCDWHSVMRYVRYWVTTAISWVCMEFAVSRVREVRLIKSHVMFDNDRRLPKQGMCAIPAGKRRCSATPARSRVDPSWCRYSARTACKYVSFRSI